MRLIVYADNHFCEKRSIVNSYGTKFSTRLENQIASINWVEQQAKEQNCDAVICLGDFFDKPQLTDMELTALRDIVWADLPHYFIVGNHESEYNNLQYSSTKALEINSTFNIISNAQILSLPDCELAFLPYIVECDRKPLSQYFPNKGHKKRIIFSHNDLKDVYLGPIISKVGFVPSEFTDLCDLCLNGHLHNENKVSDVVYCIGNLTGSDFGENAFKYKHKAIILDVTPEGCTMLDLENPYALNFYKIDIFEEAALKQLDNLKNNAVISVRCDKQFSEQAKTRVNELGKQIVDSRVVIMQLGVTDEKASVDLSTLIEIDPHTRYLNYCREKLGATEIVEAELAEILK